MTTPTRGSAVDALLAANARAAAAPNVLTAPRPHPLTLVQHAEPITRDAATTVALARAAALFPTAPETRP